MQHGYDNRQLSGPRLDEPSIASQRLSPQQAAHSQFGSHAAYFQGQGTPQPVYSAETSLLTPHELNEQHHPHYIGQQYYAQLANMSSAGQQESRYDLDKYASEAVDPPYGGSFIPQTEDEEDTYFDIDTDDEDGDEYYEQSDSNKYATALSLIKSRPSQESRPYTTFVNNENIMASFRLSPFTSPLMDPEVARVFYHYIAFVGPSLSIFERHPVNPSIILSGKPVPLLYQSLFAYTFPTMALEHQGLLQALLALSSLHIATIKGLSYTSSYRHYHYAIRRVSKAVGIPHQRKNAATLAATLILGFYEVMIGEHSKWNSHLSGATQLIREIDFSSMTRDIRASRSEYSAEKRKKEPYASGFGFDERPTANAFENDVFAQKEMDIDQGLISVLMGKAVDYDQFGFVTSSDYKTQPEKSPTEKDVEEYRIRSDLFWWYCKQDLYQSMVSGNSLL